MTTLIIVKKDDVLTIHKFENTESLLKHIRYHVERKNIHTVILISD